MVYAISGWELPAFDFDWTDPQRGTRIDPSVITSENMSRFSYTLKKASRRSRVKPLPGDRKYRLDRRRVVNTNDRTAIGNTNPLFNFGINNESFVSKSECRCFIDGSHGGKYHAFRRQLEPLAEQQY